MALPEPNCCTSAAPSSASRRATKALRACSAKVGAGICAIATVSSAQKPTWLLSQASARRTAADEAALSIAGGAGMFAVQLAKLYDLAGAKELAVKEYKNFLAKVPEHPDKKKFEKYIKDNSK